MVEDFSRRDVADFATGWRRIARGPSHDQSSVSPQFAARLAEQVGPALAAAVLLDDGRLLNQEAVKAAAAWSRYSFAAQRQALNLLHQRGITCLVLKGYASALELYSQPALRVGDDLDLLVRRSDLPLLLNTLAGAGYRLQPLESRRGGLTSDASFWPLVSPDGRCAIDLHLEGDSTPWASALPAEKMFRRARLLDDQGTPLLVPCRTDAFLLIVSNLAKDKFGALSARRILDGLRMIAAGGISWAEVEMLARRGKLLRPLRATLALLRALGAEPDKLPKLSAPHASSAIAFRRVVLQWQQLDFPILGIGEALAREWLLGASGGVAARRLLRRLRSVVKPEDARPPGWPGEVLPPG